MNTILPGNIPDGFEYYPDFISVQEEEYLLDAISGIGLRDFIFQGFLAKRKVASFGFNYNFEKKNLSEGIPVPMVLLPFIERAAEIVNIPPEDFKEALITEYPEGSVINWHRDAPLFGIIAGLSLLSDCRFRLRPYDKKLQMRGSVVSLIARRRSLYIMKGASRSEWEHSIAPVKEKRYSLTLRTLKNPSLKNPVL